MTEKIVRLLLVEDNPTDALLLEDALAEVAAFAVEVTHAERLSEALEKLGKKSVDVVLCDLGLPDSQGLDTFRRLHAAYPDVPILVLTGFDDDPTGLSAIQEGAQDYLIKGQMNGHVLARVIRYSIERRQNAAALQESQRFSEFTLNALVSHIAVLDEDGTIIAVNHAWDRFAEQNQGSPVACGVGANYLDACDNAVGQWVEGAKEAARGIREIIADDKPIFRLEYPCHSATEQRWFNMRVTRFHGEKPVRVVVAHENITERKLAEQEVAFQAKLLNEVGQAVIGSDMEGKVIYWSKCAEEVYGWTAQQAIGQTTISLITPKDQPRISQEILEQLQRGEKWDGELFFQRSDGTTFPASLTATPVYGDDGKLRGIIGISQDITERKQAEQALRTSEDRYRSIFDNSAEGIYQMQSDGRYSAVNPALTHILGYGSPFELIAAVKDTGHPFYVDQTRYAELKRELDHSGEVWNFESQVYRKDGKAIWISENTHVVRDSDGKLLHYQGNVKDITERVQIQRSFNPLPVLIGVGIAALATLWTADFLQPFTIPYVGAFWSHRLENLADTLTVIVAGAIAMRKQASLHRQALAQITERKRAEQELQESNEKFELLVDNIADTFWIRSPDMVEQIYLSPSFKEMWGIPVETQYSAPHMWSELIVPEDRERVQAAFAELMQDAPSMDIEYRIQRPNKDVRWLRSRGYQVRNEAGELTCLTGVVTDITERKQVDEALRESEHELRTLIEAIPQIVWVTRPDGWHIDFNQRWMDYTGLTLEESLGFGWNPPFHPDDRPRAAKLWQQATESGEPYIIEYRLRGVDGSYRWMLGRALPLRDVAGNIVKWFGTCTDIHDMKHAQQQQQDLTAQLEIERARLVAAQAVAKVGSWETDLSASEVVWSDETYRIYEITPQQFQSTHKSLLELVHPEDRAAVNDAFTNSLNQDSPCAIEHRVVMPDGRIKFVEERWQVVRDEQGQPIRFVGTAQDITERRLAAEKMMQLALAVEQSPVSTVITDAAGSIEYVNHKYTELTGYTSEEVLGKNPRLLNSGQTPPETYKDMWEKLPTGQSWQGEFINRRKTGELLHVLSSISSLHNHAGEITHYVELQEDITERKQAETLLAVRAHIATLGADVGVALTQPGSLQNVLHLCTEAIVKHLDAAVARIWTLDQQAAVLELQASSGLYTHLDGAHSRVPVGQLKIGLIAAERQPHFTNNVIDDPRVSNQEWARREGMVAFAGFPLIVEDQVIGVMAMFSRRELSDVTLEGLAAVADEIALGIDHKRSEQALRVANDQLEERVVERTAELKVSMRKMRAAQQEAEAANKAKSEFLSRMSHELRTPLNAILGFGQILERQELSPLGKEGVGYILSGGRHLLQLINEVLDISRVEAGRLEVSLEPIELDAIVPAVCALMGPLAAERNLRLNENVSSICHHRVMADNQRLQQVLMNLLSNAIKYNREGGEVEISCELRSDNRLAIKVRDSGPGIAPEDLPKVFTPFERLGADSLAIEGTGLGLPLAQKLVSVMGGNLSVESVVGSGTTFTVEMSQAPPEAELVKPQKDMHPAYSAPLGERSFTVLCIEDNPSNLRLMEAIFEDRPDIQLITAIQGSIGLELALQHEPDLILLDLNLPDIHGSEVLSRLQQSAITRDIPVVIVSADATTKQRDKLIAAGAKAYLTKPIVVELLLQTLDEFLKEAK